jgi:hypothetical protein
MLPAASVSGGGGGFCAQRHRRGSLSPPSFPLSPPTVEHKDGHIARGACLAVSAALQALAQLVSDARTTLSSDLRNKLSVPCAAILRDPPRALRTLLKFAVRAITNDFADAANDVSGENRSGPAAFPPELSQSLSAFASYVSTFGTHIDVALDLAPLALQPWFLGHIERLMSQDRHVLLVLPSEQLGAGGSSASTAFCAVDLARRAWVQQINSSSPGGSPPPKMAFLNAPLVSYVPVGALSSEETAETEARLLELGVASSAAAVAAVAAAAAAAAALAAAVAGAGAGAGAGGVFQFGGLFPPSPLLATFSHRKANAQVTFSAAGASIVVPCDLGTAPPTVVTLALRPVEPFGPADAFLAAHGSSTSAGNPDATRSPGVLDALQRMREASAFLLGAAVSYRRREGRASSAMVAQGRPVCDGRLSLVVECPLGNSIGGALAHGLALHPNAGPIPVPGSIRSVEFFADEDGGTSLKLLSAVAVPLSSHGVAATQLLQLPSRWTRDPARFRAPLPFYDGWQGIAGRFSLMKPSQRVVKTALSGRLLNHARDNPFVESMVQHVSWVGWRASLVLQKALIVATDTPAQRAAREEREAASAATAEMDDGAAAAAPGPSSTLRVSSRVKVQSEAGKSAAAYAAAHPSGIGDDGRGDGEDRAASRAKAVLPPGTFPVRFAPLLFRASFHALAPPNSQPLPHCRT